MNQINNIRAQDKLDEKLMNRRTVVRQDGARHYSCRDAFRARFCDVSLVMKLTNTPAPTRT